MSINLYFKQTNRATRFLLIGWILLLIAMVLPVIIIHLPNTDYARLLFLSPESMAEGNVGFPTHASIDGWEIALITFT